jgi:3-keto-L-gulonate-6-phosphate decarboxylase
VSGGFGTADDTLTITEWDILIVGRSVTDAIDPAVAARQLIDHISTLQPRTQA